MRWDGDCNSSKRDLIGDDAQVQHDRGLLTAAVRLLPGDVLLGEGQRSVQRTMGVQGRKPKAGSPLMRIVLDDGEVIRLREDAPVRIRRTLSAPT